MLFRSSPYEIVMLATSMVAINRIYAIREEHLAKYKPPPSKEAPKDNYDDLDVIMEGDDSQIFMPSDYLTVGSTFFDTLDLYCSGYYDSVFLFTTEHHTYDSNGYVRQEGDWTKAYGYYCRQDQFYKFMIFSAPQIINGVDISTVEDINIRYDRL